MNKFQQWILQMLWPEYMAKGNPYPFFKVLKYWGLQKILRFNAHVPWMVHYTSTVSEPSNIDRGNMTPGLARGNHIDGRNGIIFGKNVWIGPYVAIVSQNHDTHDYHQYLTAGPIKIGDNCWLGAHSVVLPEVELGPHTIVAAGAVVTKSFPAGDQIVGGNPAKVIKKLGPYRERV